MKDRVTIMAEIVEWPEEIDLERAEESRERAEKRLMEAVPGTDMARAEVSLKRAMARIRLKE